MSMAHVAPLNNPKNRKKYTRRFNIDSTEGHVIDMLRERAPGLSDALRHRDREDLACWLDQMILESVRLENFRDIEDDHEPARVVDLHEVTDQPIYALLKPERIHTKQYEWKVMTILTHEMGEHSYQSGKWVVKKLISTNNRPNVPMGSLGQKLVAANVTVVPPSAAPLQSVPPPAEEPAMAKSASEPTTIETSNADENAPNITLIKFVRDGDYDYEEYERGSEQLKARLIQLLDDKSVSCVRVFHEAKMKIKRIVTIELD